MELLKSDAISRRNGVEVNEYLLTKHNPNKIALPTESLKNKVTGVSVFAMPIADVDESTTAAEQATRSTVLGNSGNLRVHFYVDEAGAWQTLPLTLQGDYGQDKLNKSNAKSISVICLFSKSSDAAKIEDNAVKLVASLLQESKLSVLNLVVSDQNLNASANFNDLPKLNKESFQAKVAKYLESDVLDAPSSEVAFSVGDQVYVAAGAVDSSGNSISGIYAGAKNPLVVRVISGKICTLTKNRTVICRVDKKYLSSTFVDLKMLIPGCLVKLRSDSTWWDGTLPSATVLRTPYFLQTWNPATGRCTIGTEPRQGIGSTVGAVNYKFLEVI